MNEVEPPINSLSLSFEEALYANYLRDPDSVVARLAAVFRRIVARRRMAGSKAQRR